MDTPVNTSVAAAALDTNTSPRRPAAAGSRSGYMRPGIIIPVCIAVIYILAFGPIAAWYALYGNYGAQFGPPPWHYNVTRIVYIPFDIVARLPGMEAVILDYISWWEDIYNPAPSHNPGLYWEPHNPCLGYR